MADPDTFINTPSKMLGKLTVDILVNGGTFFTEVGSDTHIMLFGNTAKRQANPEQGTGN